MGLASDNPETASSPKEKYNPGTDYLTNVSKIGMLKENLFCIPFFNRERHKWQGREKEKRKGKRGKKILSVATPSIL